MDNKSNRLLGICLGMQLLFEESEESQLNNSGIGLFEGNCKKLEHKGRWKVPNVGWRYIEVYGSRRQFLVEMSPKEQFYFVHSYGIKIRDWPNISMLFDEYATTDHGEEKILCSFRAQNIYGCQFHPERAQEVV